MQGRKRWITNNWYKLKSLYNYIYSINISKLDFDICIIVDACRFDHFKEINRIPGTLHRILSKGSSTEEWRDKTFTKPYYNDIYITGNPYMKTLEYSFYSFANVWLNEWNKEFNTVMPYTIIENAIKYLKYNRRMYIHFIQPHYPFIDTEDNRKLQTHLLSGGFDSYQNKEKKQTIWNLYETCRDTKLKRHIIESFKNNLSRVLIDIEFKLLPHLKDKKVIITSDHGNLFGERCLGLFPYYGHTKGMYHSKLVEVPLLFVEEGEINES